MGKYELQVLDSYENETYYNGQAGSLYKQYSPLVNASLGPGKWQTYDIVFTAPGFNEKGELLQPAYFTVFHNGVLIQNHVGLRGPTEYIGIPLYKAHEEKLPLMLQEHRNSCFIQEYLDKGVIVWRLPACRQAGSLELTNSNIFQNA